MTLSSIIITNARPIAIYILEYQVYFVGAVPHDLVFVFEYSDPVERYIFRVKSPPVKFKRRTTCQGGDDGGDDRGDGDGGDG